MNEKKATDGKSELYRSLLLQRDALKKEGEKLRITYIRTFGELLEKRYSLYIECIKYKKIIAYCLARQNNGLPVRRDALDRHLEKSMEEYYADLRAFSKLRKGKTTELSEIEVFNIKKLYRKLAMELHPDLHPCLKDDREAEELWQKIVDAYERNDFKALEEAEVLAAALIAEKKGSEREIEVANAENKIKALRREIAQIVRTDPYQYKFLLEDDEAIADKKDEIKTDIKNYENYLKKLKKEADRFEIGEVQS